MAKKPNPFAKAKGKAMMMEGPMDKKMDKTAMAKMMAKKKKKK